MARIIMPVNCKKGKSAFILTGVGSFRTRVNPRGQDDIINQAPIVKVLFVV